MKNEIEIIKLMIEEIIADYGSGVEPKRATILGRLNRILGYINQIKK